MVYVEGDSIKELHYRSYDFGAGNSATPSLEISSGTLEVSSKPNGPYVASFENKEFLYALEMSPDIDNPSAVLKVIEDGKLIQQEACQDYRLNRTLFEYLLYLAQEDKTKQRRGHFLDSKQRFAYDYLVSEPSSSQTREEDLSAVDVYVQPAQNIEVSSSGNGYSMKYVEERNIWINPNGEPGCPALVRIGPDAIPAYVFGGSPMSDGCESGIVILTNQPYAIRISARCWPHEPYERVIKSFHFLEPVKAKTAECSPGVDSQ
jgi:hypothetical protein